MLKSLTRFHSANKIDNYNRGINESKKKNIKRIRKILQNESNNNNNNNNNKCFFLSH